MQATNHDSLPLPSAGRAGAPAPLLPGSPARPFYSRCNARWQRLHWYSWLSLVSAEGGRQDGARCSAWRRARRLGPPTRRRRGGERWPLICSTGAVRLTLPMLDPHRTPQSFTATIAFRCWHLLTPPSTAWLSASAALALGDVAWRRLRPRSYARLRELPAAALTYLAFGTPATWRLMDSLLNDHSVPPAGGAHPSTGGSAGTSGSSASGAGGLGWQAALPLAGAHVARLLFASGAAKECANALSLRVRLGCASGARCTHCPLQPRPPTPASELKAEPRPHAAPPCSPHTPPQPTTPG